MAPAIGPQWTHPSGHPPVDSPSSMITSSNTQLTSIAHSQQPMSSFRNTPLQYTQPSEHAIVDGPSRPRGGDYPNNSYPTTTTPHLNTAPPVPWMTPQSECTAVTALSIQPSGFRAHLCSATATQRLKHLTATSRIRNLTLTKNNDLPHHEWAASLKHQSTHSPANR